MSFKFGKASLERLGTCHIDLQRLALAAIETSHIDFAITCGHRGQKEQEDAFAKGLSKVQWPNGKHNSTPSRAFDFVPFLHGSANWNSREAFKDVAHHIIMTADQMGIDVRWGGTWTDRADDPTAKFADMPHIELKG